MQTTDDGKRQEVTESGEHEIVIDAGSETGQIVVQHNGERSKGPVSKPELIEMLRLMEGAYGTLHDIVSDIIEERPELDLKEVLGKEDYSSLVEQLAGPCCDANWQCQALLKRVGEESRT